QKLKFGLKPVIAIYNILIYRRAHGLTPQIVIVNRQIYANHYFNSSLALTTFSSSAKGSYLFYENRSRVDGLGGVFGGLKREIVESRAIDGLKAILNQSKSVFGEPRVETAATSLTLGDRGWKLLSGRGLYL